MQPYQTSALQYLDSGLGYPIPSADPFAKFPPLVGYTGKEGRIPNRQDVLAWRNMLPESNVLLRLAKDVVGIDVDDYDDKHGALTIFKASQVHGQLQAGPFSSARGHGYSGIRYYRLSNLMDERQLKGDFGPDSHVEVIRYSHRYAVVPPSWHQGAERRYEWYSCLELPTKDQLPFLTNSWYSHLTQQCKCFYEQRQRARQQLSRYRRRPSNAQGTMLAQLDLEKNIETLEHLARGSRNNYLSRIAGRTFLFDCMLNRVLDFDEVWVQLIEAALDAGLEENEIIATLHSAKSWAFNMHEEKNDG